MCQNSPFMLEDKSLIRLSDTVLVRLERVLKTCFLYDFKTDLIWTGNESSYKIISNINGEVSVASLFEKITPLFSSFNQTDTKRSLMILLEDLLDKNFLVRRG